MKSVCRIFTNSIYHHSSGGEDFEPEISDEQKKTKQKNLYETFVKERDNEERGLGGAESKDKPRQGRLRIKQGVGERFGKH